MPEEQKEVSPGFSQEELRKMLAHPDMRPCDFDRSLEAWLYRISFWGKLTINHTRPDDDIKNKPIVQEEFLNKVGDEEDTQAFGLWSIDQPAVNDVIFYRKYLSYNGKNYKEEFKVHIDLKPSLKKALDEHRHKGFFGGVKKLFGI